MNIDDLVETAHGTSASKGWWDDQRSGVGLDHAKVYSTIPEKLCLIHSEVSEALECYRDRSYLTVCLEDGKPEGLPSELADIIIRVADLVGALGIDLEYELALKMNYNLRRPHRHGGKMC